MSDTQLAMRRLVQAVQILADRTAGYIGTTDAAKVIQLTVEALDAMEGESE